MTYKVHPPVTAQYIVYSMGVTAVCLFFTLGVLNLYHHRSDRAMSRLLQLSILHYLAHVVFMHRQDICAHCSKDSVTKVNSVTPQDDMIVSDVGEKNRDVGCRNGWLSSSMKTNNAENVKDVGCRDQLIPEDVLAFIRKKMADDQEADVHERNKQQWEHAAHVVDRFLLILTSLGMFIMTIYFISATTN